MKRFTFLHIIMLVISVMFISTPVMAEFEGNESDNYECHPEGDNHNINTNINTNEQEQTQTAHNEGVKQTTIFNEAETKREHIGGSAAYAQVGSYNGKYKHGAEFLPADIITANKKTFTFEAAFEVYGQKYGKGYCHTTGHSYNGRHENNPTKEIDVYTLYTVKKLKRQFKVIGFLTIRSIKEGVDSFMVMQKGVLSAGLMKGHAFIITSEGAKTKPKSSGWGIGTFFSAGQVADHGNRGNATTGGGGTGFSKTKSELLTFPWMTIQVLQYTN